MQSTGPRTLEGKARSSKNATKHGFLSSEVLLPKESSKSLNILIDCIYNDLQPKGAMEEILVERIISAVWKLRRLGRLGSQGFEIGDLSCLVSYQCMGIFSRYETRIERSLFRSLSELKKLQLIRDVLLASVVSMECSEEKTTDLGFVSQNSQQKCGKVLGRIILDNSIMSGFTHESNSFIIFFVCSGYFITNNFRTST